MDRGGGGGGGETVVTTLFLTLFGKVAGGGEWKAGWCHSEKGLDGDRPRAEGSEVLKLSAEPPKIRGSSSQLDSGTKNRLEQVTRGRGASMLTQGFWDILFLKPCCCCGALIS
ncbi:hypothetical protein INR49_030408 [Caranx melampygus]|nr:hypothetical protein INR49_030408 [Caranx melampygus]